MSRTSQSSGSLPRSGHQATFTPVKSRASVCVNINGSDGYEPGSRRSGPAITLMRNATSLTDRAIGPFTLKPRNGNIVGATGTRPTVGRNPTTLLKLAGLRSDPPRSLPSASGRRPAATAAAAPPLDPPALFDGSYGFRVVP